MKEQLVRLICSMDKVYEEYMCNCGCNDDIIDEFVFKLNDIFKEEQLDNRILKCINSLNTKLFTDSYYMTSEFKNNSIRKQIENFILNNDEKEKILLDYELLAQYIKEDYHLIKYLNVVKKQNIIDLATINPKVLFLVDDITIDDLIDILEKNSEASLVLYGDMVDDLYNNTYLYNNKEKFLQNEQIYKLYIEGLKKHLETNLLDYIHLSPLARNDIELAEFVLERSHKLIAYMGDNIRKNKNIMIKMLKIDKKNSFYLHESLKKDKDILNLCK